MDSEVVVKLVGVVVKYKILETINMHSEFHQIKWEIYKTFTFCLAVPGSFNNSKTRTINLIRQRSQPKEITKLKK